MVHTERRKTPRALIHKLAYINFEPYNNGGIITDISEAGLRFRTVEPIEHGGLLRFSIILGAASHIEAIGELVWTDATRRSGGLRFSVLPTEAAELIRSWVEASNGPDKKIAASPRTGANHEGTAPNQGASQPEAASANDGGGAEKRSEPQVSERPTLTPTPSAEPLARPPWLPASARPSARTAATAQQPWVPPAAYQQPGNMPWITHFDPDPRGRAGSAFVRGVLGGMVLCVLLGSAAWFGMVHNGWQIRDLWQLGPFSADRPAASSPLVSNPAVAPSPSREAETVSAPAPHVLPPAGSDVPSNPNTQANPGAPGLNDAALEARPSANADSAASPEIKTPPVVTLPAGTPQLSSPGNSDQASPVALRDAKAHAEQPPQFSDPGESQLMLARQYLDGQARPRNPTVASQLLWSAVEKGNSTAETTLADLYLRGDGVARNCTQARVLLSAASGKGNPEAIQKLQELNRTGCR